MTKKNSSSYAEKVNSTSGRFVKPIDKCNALLVHEFREWDVPSLENLKHSNDSGVDAAYRYLMGVRRLVDPVAEPRSKKVYMAILFAFIAGAAACFYAFTMGV